MPYVPNNLNVYTAAFSGALAGMGANDRNLVSVNLNVYESLSKFAGAFAQSFDTAWGVNPTNNYLIAAIEEVCEGTWVNRFPPSTKVVAGQTVQDSTFFTPSTYTSLCNAIIAMVNEGSVYLSNEGITPSVPVELSNNNPVSVGTVANPGTGVTASRDDHVHALGFDTVQTVLGVATGDISVNNQKITNLGAPVNPNDAARLADTSVLSNNNPVDIGTVANPGIGVTASRDDHVHALDFGTVQTVLDTATSDVSVNNQKITNLGAPIAGNDAARLADVGAALSNNNPIAVGDATSANPGIGLTASRYDHIHPLGFATVQAVLGNATGDVSVNNQKITNLGAPVNPNDAARLTDITLTPPGGVSGSVQINNGSGGFAGVTESDGKLLAGVAGAWGATYTVDHIEIMGGTPSNIGGIRVPLGTAFQPIIGGKPTAGTNKVILSANSDELYLGAMSGWNQVEIDSGTYVTLSGNTAVLLYSGAGVLRAAVLNAGGTCFGPNATSPTFGGGNDVINVQNATTVPTSNPTNSFIIYGQTGAGKGRGSSGTITTFAPADPHCLRCGSDHALEWENETVDEYTQICVRCLIESFKEMQKILSELTKKDVEINVNQFCTTSRQEKHNRTQGFYS